MKKVIAIILSLAILFCLSACGDRSGKEAPNADANKPDTTQNTPQNTPQTQASDGSEYWGVYETDDGYLEIYDDGTFDISDFNGNLYHYGTCSFENGLTITAEDGEAVFFVLDDDGNLYGGEEVGTLYRIDPNDLPIGIHGDLSSEPVDDLGSLFSDPVDDLGGLFGESAFEGYWLNGYGDVLEIAGDEWNLYDSTGRLIQYGPMEFEGTQAWLMNGDGSSGGGYLYFDDGGNLIQSGEVMTRVYELPYGSSEAALSADVLLGEWHYANQGEHCDYPSIHFDEYGNFLWDWEDESTVGTYTFDGEEIVFSYDGVEGYAVATYHDDRIFVEGDAGSWYYRY